MYLKGSKVLMSDKSQKLIENIKIGDEVECYSGAQKVKNIENVRVSTLYKLALSNKNNIYCTGDTLFDEEFVNKLLKNRVLPTSGDWNVTRYVVREVFEMTVNGKIASRNNCTWAAITGGVNNLADVYSLEFDRDLYYVVNGVYTK